MQIPLVCFSIFPNFLRSSLTSGLFFGLAPASFVLLQLHQRRQCPLSTLAAPTTRTDSSWAVSTDVSADDTGFRGHLIRSTIAYYFVAESGKALSVTSRVCVRVRVSVCTFLSMLCVCVSVRLVPVLLSFAGT